MYIVQQKIEGVSNYQVKNTFLQYIIKKKLFLNGRVLDDNTDCLGVFLNDKYIAYSNYSDFKTKIGLLQDNETVKICDYNIQSLKTSKGYIAYSYDEVFNSNLLVLDEDFEIKEFVGLENISIALVCNDLGFQNKNNTQIHAYTLPTAQPLWQFDVLSLGNYFNSFHREERGYEVVKFIGVWQNQLIIALREHLILSLNIHTGQPIRKWQRIDGLHYDSSIKDFIPQASSFVLFGNKLLGVLHRFYFEIHLADGTAHFTDLSQQMEIYGILSIYPINSNPVDYPHIYLTAKMKEQRNQNLWSYDCVLALHLETKEIVWHHTVEESSLGINIPQYSNGKLYQLDNDNTLHIFEKA